MMKTGHEQAASSDINGSEGNLTGQKFALRPATVEDDPAIRRLVQIGRINPTGLDWRRFILAVAQDGEVIGCGQIKSHGDGTREVASIVVDPAWREQGVARAVIERLIEENPGELFLMCRSALGPFYEKFGFSSLSFEEMPKYFRRISRVAGLLHALQGEGESLLVMRRGGGA
jgi:N-acetylglutamate synthase-like GNAT family acetyltransferase